jgi:hypothetical protein
VTGAAVGITLVLIVLVITRLVWAEAGAARDDYHLWHARHVLDVSIVVGTVLFVAVVAYRFLTIG